MRRSGAERKALILTYHRVIELRSDPFFSAVTPHHFAEHLNYLRRYTNPIGLQQLCQGLLSGDLPDRPVVITFDDGYADNLYNAKPLLEHFDIPATIFVIAGYTGHESEFWWDELDRLLLRPGPLPSILRLSIGGSAYEWKLNEMSKYSEVVSGHLPFWKAWCGFPSPRHQLLYSLWELLQPLAQDERRKVLDELLAWGDVKPAIRPTHRPLSLDEVRALAQGELIEIGAHTATHPPLPLISSTSQRNEILGSKVQLEKLLGQRVKSFAYPYGSTSPLTVSIVRQVGFTCACDYYADVVERSSNRFQLPRVTVHDWDGEKFGRWVSRWFDGQLSK